MYDRPYIGYTEASQAVEAALNAACSDNGAPVAVAVVDHEGNLVAFARMDGASSRAGEFALNKAYTSARARADTTVLKDRLRNFGVELSAFADPRYTPMAGGVLISLQSGETLSGVGISGRDLEGDQKLAEVCRMAIGSLHR